MVGEKIHAGLENLAEIHVNCLMRNRMELNFEILQDNYGDAWEKYISKNMEKCSAYMEKFYDGELCLAAAEGDIGAFDDWFLQCEEMYSYLGGGIPEALSNKIHRYGQWLTEDMDDGAMEMDQETEKPKKDLHKWTIQEIKKDFRENFLIENFRTEVEDPLIWMQEKEIPDDIQRMIGKQAAESDYWHDFLFYEEPLLFLVGFIRWSGSLPVSAMEISHQVVQYMVDQCKTTRDRLSGLFELACSPENEQDIFSKSQLKQFCPELMGWYDDIIVRLEELHVLIRHENWYCLSEASLAFYFQLDGLEQLGTEEKIAYYQEIFRNLRMGVTEQVFIRMLYELEPDIFRSQIMEPLACELYDKLFAETEEEIVDRLTDFLELEGIYEEDGECIGGSVCGDDFFALLDALGELDIFDILPEQLSEEQMTLLKEMGLAEKDQFEVRIQDLKESHLLKAFGVYDRILNAWNQICRWSTGEKAHDGSI